MEEQKADLPTVPEAPPDATTAPDAPATENSLLHELRDLLLRRDSQMDQLVDLVRSQTEALSRLEAKVASLTSGVAGLAEAKPAAPTPSRFSAQSQPPSQNYQQPAQSSYQAQQQQYAPQYEPQYKQQPRLTPPQPPQQQYQQQQQQQHPYSNQQYMAPNPYTAQADDRGRVASAVAAVRVREEREHRAAEDTQRASAERAAFDQRERERYESERQRQYDLEQRRAAERQESDRLAAERAEFERQARFKRAEEERRKAEEAAARSAKLQAQRTSLLSNLVDDGPGDDSMFSNVDKKRPTWDLFD
mmetsp:Transcript_31830/g.110033  ORF Transcript_31830/g.110033 Transcript_31830/m.110033 type:complete len:304 (+) Transcript_31830:109-1020(+)